MSASETTQEFSAHFDKVDLENRLLEIEGTIMRNDAGKAEVVQEFFREIHSLKGAAATLQLDDVSHFLHAYEDAIGVLSKNIHRIIAVRNPEIFDFLLRGLDLIQRLADEQSGSGDPLKDQEDLFNLHIRMMLEARQIVDCADDYLELGEVEVSLF